MFNALKEIVKASKPEPTPIAYLTLFNFLKLDSNSNRFCPNMYQLESITLFIDLNISSFESEFCVENERN